MIHVVTSQPLTYTFSLFSCKTTGLTNFLNPIFFFSYTDKPSFLDLHGIKDITVKAGKDFELHIPYKATPKAQAQWLIDDKDLLNDDRVNVKVKHLDF